jgi:hypothetical protein
MDGKPADMREMAELSHGDETSYEIKDGHLTTDLAGTQFAVTVYKVGDKYIAVRDNEFGYANYEVTPLKQ